MLRGKTMNRSLVLSITFSVLVGAVSHAAAQSYKRSNPMAQPIGPMYFLGRDDAIYPVDPALFGYSLIEEIPTSTIPLPVAFDPNDLLAQEAFNRSDFGAGIGLASSSTSRQSLAVFRIIPNVKLDGSYDTGKPGNSDLSPSTFALQGSDAARGSGVFGMHTSQAGFKTDVQVPSVTAQLFMEIQTAEFDTLDFRQIYGRVGNVLGGNYYSAFSDSGTLPQSIVPNANVVASTGDPEVTQLQYAQLFGSGLLIGGAIENPSTNDYTLVDMNDVRLSRVPDIVGRIRYQPLDAWGSIQGAVLYRQFDYEDSLMTEHQTSAVSFSGNARFKTFGDNNVRLGGVAGRGAGNRIFGLNHTQVAAGPDGGTLKALKNIGGYASYQHFWTDNVWSNVAYGYAFADVTQSMGDKPQRSQNGWANLIWNNVSGNVAVGVEYQFGQLEVGNGQHGFNHHIHLALQISRRLVTPGGDTPTSAGVRSFRDDIGPPPTPTSEVFPRL